MELHACADKACSSHHCIGSVSTRMVRQQEQQSVDCTTAVSVGFTSIDELHACMKFIQLQRRHGIWATVRAQEFSPEELIFIHEAGSFLVSNSWVVKLKPAIDKTTTTATATTELGMNKLHTSSHKRASLAPRGRKSSNHFTQQTCSTQLTVILLIPSSSLI